MREEKEYHPAFVMVLLHLVPLPTIAIAVAVIKLVERLT